MQKNLKLMYLHTPMPIFLIKLSALKLPKTKIIQRIFVNLLNKKKICYNVSIDN